MARIRSFKPEFFRDVKVISVGPWARLLFIGLWTLADREGRLEDKPEQIDVDVFPRDQVNVHAELAALTESRLIVRYRGEDGRPYIAIPGFTKNQRPHPKEPASIIPPPPVVVTLKPDETRANTASRVFTRPAVEKNGEPGGIRKGAVSGKGALTSREGDSPPPPSKPDSRSLALAPSAGADEGRALLELYNTTVTVLPKIREFTGKRLQRARMRWREHPDSTWWQAVFKAADTEPFFRGDNDRGWKADSDYLLKNDTTAARLLERVQANGHGPTMGQALTASLSAIERFRARGVAS